MPARTPLANHNFPWLALPVSIASLIMICTLDSSIPLVHLHSGHLWRRRGQRRGLPRCFCFGTASTHSAISWVATRASSQHDCACQTGSRSGRRPYGGWRGGGFEVGLCWRAQASWEARPGGGLVICSITVIREPVLPRSNGEQLSR